MIRLKRSDLACEKTSSPSWCSSSTGSTLRSTRGRPWRLQRGRRRSPRSRCPADADPALEVGDVELDALDLRIAIDVEDILEDQPGAGWRQFSRRRGRRGCTLRTSSAQSRAGAANAERRRHGASAIDLVAAAHSRRGAHNRAQSRASRAKGSAPKVSEQRLLVVNFFEFRLYALARSSSHCLCLERVSRLAQSSSGPRAADDPELGSRGLRFFSSSRCKGARRVVGAGADVEPRGRASGRGARGGRRRRRPPTSCPARCRRSWRRRRRRTAASVVAADAGRVRLAHVAAERRLRRNDDDGLGRRRRADGYRCEKSCSPGPPRALAVGAECGRLARESRRRAPPATPTLNERRARAERLRLAEVDAAVVDRVVDGGGRLERLAHDAPAAC